MSLRRIIDWSFLQADGEMIGTIASPFYQFWADGASWMWACDVDIGQEQVLRNVPVVSNNRELIYAEMGKAVALRRMTDGRWCICGLAKTCRGLGHITFVTFEEDVVKVVRTGWTGRKTRRLTYGEIGALAPGGQYGVIPYGAIGRFDGDGNLIEIVEID